MTERGYQLDFSRDNAAMHSELGRRRKAETMLRILADARGDLSTLSVLNIGCATGIIDSVLATAFGSVTGVDIDRPTVIEAQHLRRADNVRFAVMDAMHLAVPDDSFDVVICSQVYEHVPDAARMMREIERVLRVGGTCYFAATNRLCVIEQHHFLPFLSIIPVPLAHYYLRLMGRGRHYHERHLTYFGLSRLTAAFERIDYTRRVLQEPSRFGVDYMTKRGGLKLYVARALARVAYWAFPGYLWVLRKTGATPATQTPAER
jgi:2-polyprenyl-3-methyl-5-hydroxy-6-metoxy-1,4-benzoquinol methylase